jgi:hypothetical protein
MSGGGTGGGGIIIIHPNATTRPPNIAVSDVQAWHDGLDDANPLKAILADYLASIPSG